MAEIKYHVERVALPTAVSGTVDVTSSGFGEVKFAWGVSSHGTTNDTRIDNQDHCVGFYDGTNQASAGGSSTNAPAGNTEADRYGVTDLWHMVNVNGTISEYTVSSITDGIRITCTLDNVSDARLISVTLVGGADAAGSVGSFVMDATNGVAVDVTHNLGQIPDFMLFLSIDKATSSSTGADVRTGFGCCLTDLTQRASMWQSDNNKATSDISARIETDSSIGTLTTGVGLHWTGEITAVDDTTFECTTRDLSGSGKLVIYLACYIGCGGTDLRTLSTPTSIGEVTINDMGFDPACLLMSLTTVTAVDTLKEDSEANGFQIGMAAGTDQFSICCVDEHGTTTPEAFSVASDALINLDTSTSGTRSNVIDATVAFITGGTTHDYSVVDGSALQGWSLSLEALVNSLPTYRPPCIHLSEVESRALDFHHHQIFDVITGSGEVLDSGTYLNVLQCVGSGPLYDVWLSSTCPPSNSGVDGVQVGDFLIIGEDDDHVYSTPDISWYKYHIEGILTEATSQSGEFRVRYVKDTKELGDDDPCDLYATYSNGGGYGDNPDKKVSMVVRRVNVDFLLGN